MVQFRANKDIDQIVEPILKYLIVAFNLCTFLISIGFIVGGSWLINTYNNIIGKDANISSIYDMTFDLGVFLIIIGIIGCIFTSFAIAATYRENILVLRIYAMIILCITVLNLLIGVTFLIFSGKITQSITEKLSGKYISNYFEDENIKTVYDILQSEYSCCGITDYKDWAENPYFNCTSSTSVTAVKCLVPASCCVDYTSATNLFCSGNVLSDTSKLVNINSNGCSLVIIEKASYGIAVLSGCAIGTSVILAINTILVMLLVSTITKEKALYNAKYRQTGGYEQLDNSYIG